MYDSFIDSGDFYSKSILCSAYKKIFKHMSNRLTEIN
jgi:hypothetical protein